MTRMNSVDSRGNDTGVFSSLVTRHSSLLLVFIALGIRVGVAWGFRFDGLYGQDAYVYFEEGRQLALTHRYTGLDSVGYPALIGLGTSVFGTAPRVAQGIGLLLGSLTPVMVFTLGWHLTGRRVLAWIAGLIVCVLPAHVQSSVVVMSDAPAMFWLTAGVVCGVRYLRNPSWGWGATTAVFLALATVTRYVSALVVVPLVVYAIVAGRRPPWTHLVGGGLIGLVLFIPEFVHMRVNIPSLFLLQGWSPLNAVRREFQTLDGALRYDWPVVVADAKALAGWGFFNPVLAGLAVVGGYVLRAERATMAFILTWILGLYGFLIGLPLVNPRYLLPLIVPISLLSAAGLVGLWGRTSHHTSGARLAFSAVIVFGLIGLGVGNVQKMRDILIRKRCELQAVEWLDRHLPAGSPVIAFDVAHAVRQYGRHPMIHLHEIDPSRLHVPAGSAPGLYLIWDEALAARVARHRPGPDDLIPRFAANDAWLRDGVQRTRLARICQWDVVRLNGVTSDR
ncbi:MAG: phospholipid carrier-dependent glycosyltransferase [Candidatus Latescibacteria bacterium]|nr:phospholipid carrier-dependent glycosyltransferase [Candidatus Latescibacterota bacterium]